MLSLAAMLTGGTLTPLLPPPNPHLKSSTSKAWGCAVGEGAAALWIFLLVKLMERAGETSCELKPLRLAVGGAWASFLDGNVESLGWAEGNDPTLVADNVASDCWVSKVKLFRSLAEGEERSERADVCRNAHVFLIWQKNCEDQKFPWGFDLTPGIALGEEGTGAGK